MIVGLRGQGERNRHEEHERGKEEASTRQGDPPAQ